MFMFIYAQLLFNNKFQTIASVGSQQSAANVSKDRLKGGFSFFHRRGGKILGGVQVICNMPFLMLWKGHEMANQSVPGGGGEAKFLWG